MSSYFFHWQRKETSCSQFPMMWKTSSQLSLFPTVLYVSLHCFFKVPLLFCLLFFPWDMHKELLASFLGKTIWINKEHELASFSWSDLSKTTALWLFVDFMLNLSQGGFPKLNHWVHWRKDFVRTWSQSFTYEWSESISLKCYTIVNYLPTFCLIYWVVSEIEWGILWRIMGFATPERIKCPSKRLESQILATSTRWWIWMK
jgi:hypothetical protein